MKKLLLVMLFSISAIQLFNVSSLNAIDAYDDEDTNYEHNDEYDDNDDLVSDDAEQDEDSSWFSFWRSNKVKPVKKAQQVEEDVEEVDVNANKSTNNLNNRSSWFNNLSWPWKSTAQPIVDTESLMNDRDSSGHSKKNGKIIPSTTSSLAKETARVYNFTKAKLADENVNSENRHFRSLIQDTNDLLKSGNIESALHHMRLTLQFIEEWEKDGKPVSNYMEEIREEFAKNV